mgnify:CR=1 FL=1
MGKKYLDTKEGSLEQSVLGVWQTAIEEGETRVDGRTKSYKEHRAKLEAARLRREKLVGGQKKLDKDKDGDIDGKDFAMLRKSKKKDKKEEVEESYEIGTDKYRKHTEDVTPGEDGEWVEAINAKNQTMREALAKVWSVDEGKSPFKKEDKKGDKTLTGKKVASVDVNPTIKEKTK